MNGILAAFREKVFGHSGEINSCSKHIDDHLLALGVLLWAVAEADNKFLPSEENEIKRVLKHSGKILEEDIAVVMMAVKQAAFTRVDLFQFTNDIKVVLERPCRIGVIENLFRVAYIDNDLDEIEASRIRQISGLLGLDHDEYIKSKEKVRTEALV